jgi:hypothetical protein
LRFESHLFSAAHGRLEANAGNNFLSHKKHKKPQKGETLVAALFVNFCAFRG